MSFVLRAAWKFLSWGCDLNRFGFETVVAEAAMESEEPGDKLAKGACGQRVG